MEEGKRVELQIDYEALWQVYVWSVIYSADQQKRQAAVLMILHVEIYLNSYFLKIMCSLYLDPDDICWNPLAIL